MPAQTLPRPISKQAPSLWRVFGAWVLVGAQSFGGGQATLALIRRVIVEQQGWISEADFARDLTICQLAPGMNLFALTVLVGKRVGGAVGAAVSLFGLLLPSITLTLLITAFWGRLRLLHGLDRSLTGGIVPAVVGVGLWNSWQTGRTLAHPVLPEDEKTKPPRHVIATRWGIALFCGLVAYFAPKLPVFVILIAGGCAGMLLARPASAPAEKENTAS